MWEIWNLAKTYKARPSDLVDVSDKLNAFYLDRAVFMFGTHVESEMEKAASDAKDQQTSIRKRQAVLDKYLGTEKKPVRKRYADPARKKVKL